jgi:aspartate/methionine/tyrosine aminotransferase
VSQRFSSRTNWDLGESTFARAIRVARATDQTLLDLTVSNPTACGFQYDAGAILHPLSSTQALAYDPDPRGMLSAREAVAAYYADHNARVGSESVNLTTSTSEAYGYLFRLLCNAGDEILVPQPSYPLFDYLADLEDVRLQPYPLFYDYGWWIDFALLESRITPRTRAILLVHPNNPTGHATARAEREKLEDLCQRHNLALIVDEVFLDYPHGAAQLESFATGPHPALTFVLSGMSKIAGLPQMKVGWIVTLGADKLRHDALARLEIIADTFLSMNAPAQLALPSWLASRKGIQNQIIARLGENLRTIDASPIERLLSDGGWSAILRLPDIDIGAEQLLSLAGVIVHPGSFYGLAEAAAGRIVISLITPPADFSTGIQRIAKVSK